MKRSHIVLATASLLALALIWWLSSERGESEFPSVGSPAQGEDKEVRREEAPRHTSRESTTTPRRDSEARRRYRPAEEPSVWLQGHVTDWNGRPVSGAGIVVRGAAPADDLDPFEARLLLRERVLGTNETDASRVYATTSTGDQGEYSINPSSLTPAVYQVAVSSRGWAPQHKTWVWTGVSEEVNFTIGPGVSIQGRVVGADGQALQGVSVQALTQGDEGRGNWSGRFELVSEAESETDGSFLLDVYPGNFQLTARAEGHAPVTVGKIESGTTGVLLRLSPGCGLKGVVEGLNGEPLPEAEVRLWIGPMAQWSPEAALAQSRFSTPFEQTPTDLLGRFVFEDLPAGPATIIVQRAGHGPAIARVTVRDGATEDGVRIRLRPGHSLEGRVMDRTRQPLAGALVAVLASGDRESSRRSVWPASGEPIPLGRATAVTETDRGGNFSIDTLPVGSYQVSADADGFQPARLFSVEVSRTTPFLTIELDDGFTLTGRVRDSLTRLGIPGATLVAGRTGHPQLARTDTAGRYELKGLPEGEIDQIQIRADGYGLSVLKGVELVGPASSLDIFLEAGAEVEGRVVDEHGQPVSGAWVHIQPALQQSGLDVDEEGWDRRRLIRSLRVSVRSNGAGQFRLVGITPGPDLVLYARHPFFQAFVTETLTLGAGQQLRGVEIVLDEADP